MPERHPDTSDGSTPSVFLTEYLEVMRDLHMDLGITITDIDPEVGKRMSLFVQELFKLAAGDPGKTITNLMTGMLWMWMGGREPALRGYASPIGKYDPASDGWVPDTIEGL